MCTVSVVAFDGGVRLVSNRDELRTRPRAAAPERRHAGGLQAIWPVDPASGGTWIGVNDAGVAMTILNRGARTGRPAPAGLRSRGTIIPSLLHLSRLAQVLHEARHLPGPFEPFTLVVVQGTQVAALTSTDPAAPVHTIDLTTPLLFTSSSLGDDLVAGPRQALFDRLVRSSRTPLAGQAKFHRHAWKARPEISVRMSRPDAMTVSRTTVEITSRVISMNYTALDAVRRPITSKALEVELRIQPPPDSCLLTADS